MPKQKGGTGVSPGAWDSLGGCLAPFAASFLLGFLFEIHPDCPRPNTRFNPQMQHHPFFSPTLKCSLARPLWPRRAALLLAIAASLGSVLTPAHAQGSSSSRSGTYKLGPGDVLSLTVAGYPEFGQQSIVVPPDGAVTLPTYGTIRLSGRTRLDVQNQMRDVLVRRVGMRHPSIALIITTARPPAPTFIGRVILSGDVPRPGSFDVRRNERLSDLLAEAGAGERLEEKRAILARGGRRTTLNLKRAAQTPGGAADLFVRPGDSIAVSAVASGKITISGDVARPGSYELHLSPRSDTEITSSPRLSDLLTRAGWQRSGASAKGASATDVSTTGGTGAPTRGTPAWTGTLQRGGQTRAIHPDAALGHIGGSDDISLRAGDFVSVAQVPPITVFVDGLVARVGSYSVAPGTGVLELLTQAGGIAGSGSHDDILAGVRRGGQFLPLDLNALLSTSSSANLTLQNGDYVQLRAPETLDVQVAGQVARSGIVQVKPGSTLFEAINLAGGVSGAPADLHMTLLRREPGGAQTILPVDAPAVLEARDMKTNYTLQRGDVINVARVGTQTVFINGEVVNPNSFTLRGDEGLTKLLTRAGGPKDDALLSGISVTRAGQVIKVDALDAVRKGTPLNFALQDGDQVIVQKNPNVVKVIGAAKEGDYYIPERGQLTLVDVLTKAGTTGGAKQVFVAHALADGTYSKNTSAIKIDALLHGKAPNVVLQPHDVVYVPSPKNKRPLLDTLGQLSVFRLFF